MDDGKQKNESCANRATKAKYLAVNETRPKEACARSVLLAAQTREHNLRSAHIKLRRKNGKGGEGGGGISASEGSPLTM